MSGIRLGMVTLGANVPSTRFRFLPYLEPLRSRGHTCRLWTSFPSVYDHFPAIGWRLSQAIKTTTRWLQYADALRFRPDTLYLERGCYHDASVSMDRRFCRAASRVVLDVDDGVFLNFPEKIKQLLAWSDHVVVSNGPIREWVSQYHSQITEIPTCISLARYSVKIASQDSPVPVVGWIGTTSNMGFLDLCREPLRRLARDRTFRLLVVGPTDVPLREMDWSGVDVRFERWQPETEIAQLHAMDIGLMPLPEGQEWMRYKAATKLVQYMATGMPAVASPIGVNAEILEGNRVGFAARGPDDWYEAVKRLLDEPELRLQMGSVGRQLAVSRFSVEANLDRLEGVLLGSSS